MEDIQAVDLALSAEPTPDLPEALQAPIRQVSRGFMFALTAAAISLYILYAGIGALLLPFQIGLIAPGSKVAILSFFTSITVLIALFANPLAGAFSDRTTSRFGRRRPWIVVGGLLTAVGLLFMWRATSIPLLFIGYCLVSSSPTSPWQRSSRRSPIRFQRISVGRFPASSVLPPAWEASWEQFLPARSQVRSDERLRGHVPDHRS